MPLKYSPHKTVFVFLTLIALGACREEDNPLLSTNAGKLAAIDADTTSITESQVAPYEALLSRLSWKCADTETGISDTAVQATNIFQSRKGREVSALSVMRMIDGAIPEGTKLNCDEVIAAIIALS